MSSVGSYLRERREARGFSLKEMARSTRVRERYLEAIEADEFAGLPAPVFTRGFLRAYCQVLSEPSEEALRLYAEQTGTPVPSPEVPRPTRTPEREGRGREPVLISLVLLIVLGLALFALTFALQSRSKPQVGAVERRDDRVEPVPLVTSPPPTTPATAIQASPAPPQQVAPSTPPGGIKPAVTAPSTPPRTPGVTTTAAYRLVARATEIAWVRVRTEDGRVTEETMSPGEVREWMSNRRFVLTIGNAGGIALELNGQPLPPLGPSGTVIPQLVIPPDRQ